MSIIIKSGVSGNLAVVDSLGNLQVLASPAAISQTAAPWTSATVINTDLVLLSTGGYAAIIVQLNQTSTITAGAVTFEGTYDGINWASLASNQVLDPTTFAASSNPYSLQPNTNHTVLLLVGGFQQIRVRLSTVITGTGNVTTYWTLQSQSPLQTSGTVSVTGTVNVAQSGNWTTRIVGNAGATLDQAPGSVIPTNALFVGGSDGTNLRALSTDSSGQLKVLVQNTPSVTVSGTVAVTQSGSWTVTANAGSGTFSVSGTVTANQGGAPWSVVGNVASGASDSGNPIKSGAIFNTTQPTVTNGQRVDNQATARGGLIVATGVDTFNVTVNAALPAGSNVIGHVISDSGSTTAVTGNVTVVQSTAANLNATVTGTVAATQSGTWNIGTLTSITNTVTVSGTVTANAGSGTFVVSSVNLELSQGSTTSGQKGPLVQGAVTTSAPAYTTGQTSPFSLTTAGALRVDGSAVTQPVSGTITANQGGAPWSQNITQVGGASVTLGSKTSANSFPVVIASDQGAVSVAQSGSWTVTANAGSGTFTTSDANAQTQGSTTSGQKGFLEFGAVTTNAPAYTTGQSSPFSLDTSGLLRVSLKDTPANTNAFKVDGSAVTQPVSGTVTANAGSGTFNIQANASVNVNQISGSAISTAAAGTQLVGLADGSGNVLTSNSTTFTAKQALDVNLLGSDGTAFSTAGKLDVKGADGDIFVRQATAANLNATVVFASAQPVTQSTTPWTIQGDSASGAANGGNPVKVGGVFNTTQPTVTTGQTVDAQATSRGALIVATGVDAFAVNASQSGTWNIGTLTSITNTVTISGTVTANIGTTNGLALDTSVNGILVAQGSTTSGEKGPLVQGAVTTSAPSYTTGQTSPLSLTTAGALRVDGSAVTQPVSGTVTANAGSGTFTTSDTNIVAQASATSGQKGPLVQGAVTTNAPSYTTGQTDPVSLDTSGLLRVSVKDTPSNTNNFNVNIAASAATVTVSGTVTANAGSGTFNTSDGNAIAQGSTTSGQKGFLELGAVTTAAPTYSTGQSSPFSLTTGGGLRVDAATWAGTVLGTPVNFGTSPGAVIAGNQNASIFAGTTALVAKSASIPASVGDAALVVTLSANNLVPNVIQKTNAVSGGAVLTLNVAYPSANSLGNTGIIGVGLGNFAASNWSVAITDTQGNTWSQDVIINQGTTLAAVLFHAENLKA